MLQAVHLLLSLSIYVASANFYICTSIYVECLQGCSDSWSGERIHVMSSYRRYITLLSSHSSNEYRHNMGDENVRQGIKGTQFDVYCPKSQDAVASWITMASSSTHRSTSVSGDQRYSYNEIIGTGKTSHAR